MGYLPLWDSFYLFLILSTTSFYTSTATSKNNNLWFSPNIVEKQYEWTISYSKCVEIQNVYNTKRIIWANASANRFAGYTSKQQEVILYKYME
mgnify:CR=1 FL=1